MRRLFLGLDLSTTGAKALLIDERGAVAGSASTSLTVQNPRPLWSEQDPGEWWSATVASIRQALSRSGTSGAEVAGVGLTGQMHGLVLLDGADRVLRPAILWNDQRTAAQCDEVRARLGGRRRLLELTGNDALTGFTAPKILWVREHEPDLYARARRILLPKDYLRLRLTGVAAMDKADGSGTLLFDVAARDWSKEVLERLEIPASWLPPTFEGPAMTGRVGGSAAAETGLAQGTPVVAGGGDQAAGAIGAGAVAPGVVSVTLGTSGVVFVTTDRPLIEPQGRLHAFCHAVPGKWHFMGVTLSAAGSLQWFRDALAPGVSFEALVSEAAQAPVGSEGLLFLPYLSGERTPHPDPQARGSLVGLTVRHQRAHLTRAILEGVAYSLRDCFDLLARSGAGEVREVRLTGGGARSQLWRRICASVLGQELLTLNSTEGAAFGAALLAGAGLGAWDSVEAACQATLSVIGRDVVDPVWKRAYDDAYPRYRELYPALKPSFDAASRSSLQPAEEDVSAPH